MKIVPELGASDGKHARPICGNCRIKLRIGVDYVYIGIQAILKHAGWFSCSQ